MNIFTSKIKIIWLMHAVAVPNRLHTMNSKAMSLTWWKHLKWEKQFGKLFSGREILIDEDGH